MRICFVGDSFVNGTGDPECLGWAGRICAIAHKRDRNITYYNLGVRRETSTNIKARWLKEATDRLPTGCDGRIVFSFGVNDTTLEQGQTRVALEDSIENTFQILTAAGQLFPVLMVSPPPVPNMEQNRRICCLSEQLSSVCHKLDVSYLDVFTALQKSDVWMNEAATNDGFHPGSAGYSELARLVQSWSAWLSWFK